MAAPAVASVDLHATVSEVRAAAYRIPTDFPEADGTLAWDSTTLVVVEVAANGVTGLGYTYADMATATLVNDLLAHVVTDRNPMDVPMAWHAMRHATRNLGAPGIVAMAIAAVDSALWDLKARLLDLPLVTLLGAARDAVPVYGSGGFTSYPVARLTKQLGAWVASGIGRVKMKVGSDSSADGARVHAARLAIGPGAGLMVDANGAYRRKQALDFAVRFRADDQVEWFEEPVPSSDLAGLRLLRDRAPGGMAVAAGEYGYEAEYFRRMLEAGAVDVLQGDASRCGGITGFLQAAQLAKAFGVPFSAHCAPSLHLHPCCAAPDILHLEYFHDHIRIEDMLFDGAISPRDGVLKPDLTRPGMGLELKHADAARYAL